MPQTGYQEFDLWTMRDFDVQMTADDRRNTASGLRDLLRDYYVHLPQKVGAMAINPDRELELLADDAPLYLNNLEFLDRLNSVFTKLRDRHTALRLPDPLNRMIAFLPVVLESCYEGGRRVLLVSRIAGEVPDDKLEVGVEVTHWNGTPVAHLINQFSWSTPGSNPYARIALAQRSLTLRALGYMQMPQEDWVTLSYISLKGERRHVSLNWRIALAPDGGGGAGGLLSGAAMTTPLAAMVGLDEGTEIINTGLKDIFAKPRRASVIRKREGRHGGLLSEPLDGSAGLQNLMSASTLTLDDGRAYGYLRLFSFSVPDVRGFAEEMAQVLRQMPPAGLIIDVRGNPGGTIPAGEALLHMITDRAIEPTRNVFRASRPLRTMSGAIAFFQRWHRSLEMVYETGQGFSQGFELSDPEHYAGLEHSYGGPVVVVIDALSYSTTDYFVAGFEDNRLGHILGLDPTTGAGGANVWSLSQISGFAAEAGLPPIPHLPVGMDCRVAVRRALRAGPNRGLPLEGLGATATQRYFPTRRDVLGVNEDMLIAAVNLLQQPPP